MVLDDDQEWDEQEACDDDGGSIRHEVEREYREGCGGDDRGQRDVTGEQKDDDEYGQSAESAGPVEGQEDSEGRGNAFASAEGEPDGEDVAEDRCYGRCYGQPVVRRG